MSQETTLSEQQKAEMDRVAGLVEQYLEAEGLDLGKVRLESGSGYPAWAFTQGSALVQVHLRPGRTQEVVYFQAVAPVVTLPEENREAFFRHLLELNADELWSCAFAVRQDTVIVTADRTTVDMDLSEIVEMVESVAAYADRFDDELAEEFRTKRYTDTRPSEGEKPEEGE